MLKYVGRFRVFHEITLDCKPSINKDANYLKCRVGNGHIYRYDKKYLALMLFTSHSRNVVIPELEKLGVNFTIVQDGDTECTLKFPEKQIDLVTLLVKPMTKGKNISPKSKKTINRLKKELEKKNS